MGSVVIKVSNETVMVRGTLSSELIVMTCGKVSSEAVMIHGQLSCEAVMALGSVSSEGIFLKSQLYSHDTWVNGAARQSWHMVN